MGQEKEEGVILLNDKLLELYRNCFTDFVIVLYDSAKTGDLIKQLLQKQDSNFTTLTIFFRRLRSDENFAEALILECVEQICLQSNSGLIKQQNSNFLSNIACYFFVNIWQEDKELCNDSNFLFRVYQRITINNFGLKRDH
jgi:hypothetical protein